MSFSSIVILTGAGISAESGVDTFRDKGGIWSKVDLRDVATPEGFARDPERVHAFYNERRSGLSSVEPNAAHRALAQLEAEFAGDVLVVTQNIDNLHERGGSKRLIHMHGELTKIFCTKCGTRREEHGDLTTFDCCPQCGAMGTLRPDVVWFGEMPYQMDEISEALQQCDLFVSIGTSGNVYPAAGFVEEAHQAGAHTVELNLEASEHHTRFAEVRRGRATELVPAFVEELLGR
ncbi:NAD-dependent deacylase [Tianweitania sediminis]|jgi:NAD-dependent deacetylase|uniref:NAD-dependent protein deacylase n=1 Tax=Tianweitania sediminis TaxID=1502156 RepID=A0A8J7RN32_9HYPH|nr:NAD-dependent deacylase [Tianweitania sediminis]MBP0438789.1 NAD-dependent deacylase [Tianweitania sediminis]HEV7416428.1 NAD-dependent deacylase [Tianweitania sediminis]